MAALIEEFEEEHRQIIDRLLESKRLGVHSMEGRNTLCRMQELLLTHLEKEDKNLYPALREHRERNPELRKMLDLFEEELTGITAFCSEFFEKYVTGGGGIDFFRDCDKLYKALENRIQKEEDLLFPYYRAL